jgi:hypothetical protein
MFPFTTTPFSSFPFHPFAHFLFRPQPCSVPTVICLLVSAGHGWSFDPKLYCLSFRFETLLVCVVSLCWSDVLHVSCHQPLCDYLLSVCTLELASCLGDPSQFWLVLNWVLFCTQYWLLLHGLVRDIICIFSSCSYQYLIFMLYYLSSFHLTSLQYILCVSSIVHIFIILVK